MSGPIATGTVFNYPLIYVAMKTRRAQFHLDALEVAVKDWVDSKPYTIRHYDDFQQALHVIRIEDKVSPEIIPMTLGDFVCCLRAALDQLAWALAHLQPGRVFTEREERNIAFPIAKVSDNTYTARLGLFPPAAADLIDSFQPYKRGNAFADHPLWQLNELWNMDKHRFIPINCTTWEVTFPLGGFLRHFTNTVEMCIPIASYYQGQMNFEPSIAPEILFGEHMGKFEVSMSRIKEINQFFRDDMMPKFASFFT